MCVRKSDGISTCVTEVVGLPEEVIKLSETLTIVDFSVLSVVERGHPVVVALRKLTGCADADDRTNCFLKSMILRLSAESLRVCISRRNSRGLSRITCSTRLTTD